MRAAMGVLALLAIVGGIVAIPKTTSWLDNFLAPTFADSTLVAHPSNGLLALGLDPRRRDQPRRHRASPTTSGSRGPSLAPAIAARFAPLTTLFENKWYFDELIDALVVRPGAWFGRFAQNTFERARRQRRAGRRHDRPRARRLGARARHPERAAARLRRADGRSASPASASTSCCRAERRCSRS